LTFWTRAFSALQNTPLFGIGFQRLGEVIGVSNIHSGYVYVILTRGIVGGLIHLGFLILVVRQRLDSLEDGRNSALLALFVVVIIIMVFDSLLLFGFASHAVWPALVVGYSLQTDV
jgi:O-antigen ligase